MGVPKEIEYVRPDGWGVRHTQTILLFMAMFLAFTMRVNMSMAIVDMTNANSTNTSTNNAVNITEYYANFTNLDNMGNDGLDNVTIVNINTNTSGVHFDWDLQKQAMILSSFFWGYVVLQIPGGELAKRLGGKILITISVAVNSLISLVLPVSAKIGGWKFVIFWRVLQGLTQALLYPSMHHLVSQWIPLEEKGRLSTIIYAGGQLGIASQLIVSGFLANAWGWQAIFYANGVLGLLWTVAYLFLGSQSPEASKLISKEELSYIQTSLGRVGKQKKYPTPYRKIALCLPFWAAVIAHCGQNWGFFTLMTEMPTYMSEVLHFKLAKNGALSSLPYLAMFLLSFPMGTMTDLIIRRNWLSVSNTRKLFNSIGLWGPALALVGLSLSPARIYWLPVVMLVISVGVNAGQYTGFMLTFIDLAPNFSSSLMGVSNFCANIISIIAPLVCGLIVNDKTDALEWHKVFYLASGVYLFTNLFFVLCSTSDRQAWNEPADKVAQFDADVDKLLGVRHLVVLLLFLATVVSYATRVSMSVTILAMTKPNDYGYEVFDWDQSTRDTILSSFFWGYIVLQIPAGMLAGRFGGWLIILVSMAMTGLVNLILPYAAIKGGWQAVCGCRIAMGLFQGLLYPSLHGLLGQWAPAEERSRMGTIVYSGAQLGTIIEMMIAGVLCGGGWGWPAVYYVAGAACLVWAVLWFVWGASDPRSSRWISKEEMKYIESSAGSHDINEHKKMPIPWKSIWTSLPFWSILLAHCGQSLGFWTLLTEMPSYMDKVLGVDIKSNGLLSALPYVAMYILSFIFSLCADLLVNRNICSLATCRKIFNTIAFWGPAASLLALSYIPAGHLSLAVVMLTLTVGLNGAHYVGFLISHIDVSPNFASTLMGITNGCGNIFSILAPLSVSFVVSDTTSAADWRKVFFISIAFYFLSNLFFLLFMSAKVQPWNEPPLSTAVEDGVKKSEEATRKSAKKEKTGEHKF